MKTIEINVNKTLSEMIILFKENLERAIKIEIIKDLNMAYAFTYTFNDLLISLNTNPDEKLGLIDRTYDITKILIEKYNLK